MDGLALELLSTYQLLLRARTRYEDQQREVDESRVRRGVAGGPPIGLSGTGFASRLRDLLPPERTLSALDRMLTARAAEGLARHSTPPSVLGQEVPESVFFVLGAGLLPTSRATGEEPTDEGQPLPANYPPASRMLGLAQRTFGVPIDSTLAEALGFLDRDPIGAKPLPSAREFRARRAAEWYGLAGGQVA